MENEPKGGRAKPICPWRWCVGGEQAQGSHAGWHQLQFADNSLDEVLFGHTCQTKVRD